jgi:hypothetical protein
MPPDAGAALYSGDWRLRRGGDLAGDGHRLSCQRTNRIFATIMPLVVYRRRWRRCSAAGCWSILNAIFATLFAITLLLMLPPCA